MKKAYRQLSLIYHPDKNPDPAAATYFAEFITKAYKTLTGWQLPLSQHQVHHYSKAKPAVLAVHMYVVVLYHLREDIRRLPPVKGLLPVRGGSGKCTWIGAQDDLSLTSDV